MLAINADQVAYTLVFNIADAGYRQKGFAASALPFVLVGIVLVALRSRLTPTWVSRPRRFFAWLFLGFSVFWTVIAFGLTYFEYARLVAATRSGQVRYVEGPVQEFVPMPYDGHAMESFSVGGKRFEYSDYNVTAGFNNTSSHGGPIKSGRRVRVGYVDDTIVRLEVAE